MDDVSVTLQAQEWAGLINVLAQLPNSSNTYAIAVKIQEQTKPAEVPVVE